MASPEIRCPDCGSTSVSRVRANSEILMVGDSMLRDMEPAKKMGLKTALSKYGQTMDETGTPDYELADFKDLIDIV